MRAQRNGPSGKPCPAEVDLRAAWLRFWNRSATAVLPFIVGGGSYLDSSISRTLFASVDMANGFVSTDIPGSR